MLPQDVVVLYTDQGGRQSPDVTPYTPPRPSRCSYPARLPVEYRSSMPSTRRLAALRPAPASVTSITSYSSWPQFTGATISPSSAVSAALRSTASPRSCACATVVRLTSCSCSSRSYVASTPGQSSRSANTSSPNTCARFVSAASARYRPRTISWPAPYAYADASVARGSFRNANSPRRNTTSGTSASSRRTAVSPDSPGCTVNAGYRLADSLLPPTDDSSSPARANRNCMMPNTFFSPPR